jgi:hypothetical protein
VKGKLEIEREIVKGIWRRLYRYVVASKCSRYYLISEKYVRVQSFKIDFFENSPLVEL